MLHFQIIIDITGTCSTIDLECVDSPVNITFVKKKATNIVDQQKVQSNAQLNLLYSYCAFPFTVWHFSKHSREGNTTILTVLQLCATPACFSIFINLLLKFIYKYAYLILEYKKIIQWCFFTGLDSYWCVTS